MKKKLSDRPWNVYQRGVYKRMVEKKKKYIKDLQEENQKLREALKDIEYHSTERMVNDYPAIVKRCYKQARKALGEE